VVKTPTRGAELLGIACAKPTECWAVGSSGLAGQIDEWNGSAWSVSHSFYSGPEGDGDLDFIFGVACAGASCFAVGGAEGNSADQAFIESTGARGSWALDASPYVTGLLRGVACVTASDCWAVGTNFVTSVIEHWNGSKWSLASSPKPKTGDLYAISCPTLTSCVATGSAAGKNYTTVPLVESWNGHVWSKVSAPSVKLAQLNTFLLTGVSCRSAKFCVATGPAASADIKPFSQILIESWNGSRWSLSKAPVVTASGYTNEGSSVSCPSTKECWVVGEQFSHNALHVLVESWNGSKWSVVRAPNPVADDSLAAVTCLSTTACWAAGAVNDKYGGNHHTLVERYR
jgi:hypothetical protein